MTELIWDGKYDKDGRRVAPLRIALPFQTVETVNETAQQRQRTLDLFSAGRDPEWRNRLIWGDKKYVLPSLLPDFAGQVNLIYIDPPFATGADFSFSVEINGETFTKEPSIIEQKAYRDTWGRGLDSYLQWFFETAVVLYELLSDNGSIYVHLDPNVGHYAKLALDEVFGRESFNCEIVWKRKDAQSSVDTYGAAHDTIYFYHKGPPAVFNKQFAPLSQETADTWYTNEEILETDIVNRKGQTLKQGTVRRFNKADISAPGPRVGTEAHYQWKGHWPPPGRHWAYRQEVMQRLEAEDRLAYSTSGRVYEKRYLDESAGVPAQSVWTDISFVRGMTKHQAGSEWLDYPTQKPEALLERIIKASSNEGDLVLDCFCVRKGTRVLVAEGEKTPLSPPVNGGKPDATATPLAPSPWTGRAGVGSSAIAIEDLRPGDMVFAHDGQPHRVVRTVSRRYRGTMIGVRREGSEETLWLTPDHRVLCQRRVQAMSRNGEWKDILPGHFERARELRREMTPPERELWQHLRGDAMGVKFRRQHPIGPYIADFYARQASLVVEIDGAAAHTGPEAAAHDAARDRFMRDMGLNVIRIPASQWGKHPEGVLEVIYHACAEHTLPDQPDKQWLYTENLRIGDVVYVGREMSAARIAEVLREETDEEVYDIEVEGAHSYNTEVCAVHNCGSGTTAAVAEKLGRRWIACDLGRFAIHTTRKRLLSIDNVRPFDVQNLGKYERQAWQAAEFGDETAARTLAYRRFILDLYHAEPLTGYTWLHGVRRGRMAHVGAVDAPISTADVSSIVMEFKRAMGAGKDAPTTNGIDILGWDFAFELNEVAKQQAALAKVDVRMLRIPRDVMDKRAVEQGDIQFFELGALAVDVHVAKRDVTLTLTDFVIPPDEVPEDVQRAIKNWAQWIDYWAVDWDNKGDAFHNEWQTYRTRKSRDLVKSITHRYDESGEYTVVVKVIDILGNDTTKTLKVRV